ncbi:MAG: PilZ domain-containing protein [Candidatus Manganitrophaceae bacterium]|nr:MAG: PilZ domain-containing protein [Candidatus Manganitrophaceae bacterium]
MADEQRASKRVPFIRDIEIVGVGRRRTMDLSTGGMYIEMVADFQTGTEFELQFKLTDGDPKEIRVRARVLYIHPGIGAGVEFCNLSAPDEETIRKWIDQHSN